MRSDDYRRLREALIEMALQRSDSPEAAQWLAVAQACIELEQTQALQQRYHRGHNPAARPLKSQTAK
jgi:hypothetical protein